VTDNARTTSPRKACEKSHEETTAGVTDNARTMSPRKASEKSREETTPRVTDAARIMTTRKAWEKTATRPRRAWPIPRDYEWRVSTPGVYAQKPYVACRAARM